MPATNCTAGKLVGVLSHPAGYAPRRTHSHRPGTTATFSTSRTRRATHQACRRCSTAAWVAGG
eukprot:5674525-Prymnesium_polylepis.1